MRRKPVSEKVIARNSAIPAVSLITALAACGGGGSSSVSTPSLATAPPTAFASSAPSSRTVYSGTVPWTSSYYEDSVPTSFDMVYGPLGQNTFTGEIFSSSTTHAPSTSSQEVIAYRLAVGTGSPLPPAAGKSFAYIQFRVEPSAITLPAGGRFGIAAQTTVIGSDAFNIPPGTYIECTVYAGGQLVGSGSNAYVSEGLNTGYLCNAANHGNSQNASSYFAVPSIQEGTTYTIVYSVLE